MQAHGTACGLGKYQYPVLCTGPWKRVLTILVQNNALVNTE
jgi:hypothetical protein